MIARNKCYWQTNQSHMPNNHYIKPPIRYHNLVPVIWFTLGNGALLTSITK